MKIIIISVTFYPSQSPRALRTTELAFEFAHRGHEVTVYAHLGDYDYREIEKKKGVKVKNIKTFFPMINSDGKKVGKFNNSILNKIFSKLFQFINYPDIELMFRIPSIIKKEKKPDLLISIAVPHSIHWGCAWGKKKCEKIFPDKWIADCGDPFMGNPFHKRPFYFKYLEKWFCNNTDYVTVPIEGAKKAYFEEYRHKIKVIPQGFNFNHLKLYNGIIANEIPTFSYSGVFYKNIRDPRPFLDYLCTREDKFKFIIYTKNHQVIAPYLNKLGEKIEFHDYIRREQLIYELSTMDFLVNFENNSEVQIPSKLIDYAYTKRPILSIGNNFDKSIVDEFLEGNYSKRLIVDVTPYYIENVVDKLLNLIK
ncbi:MAG: glycosyltransferase [Prevotella sp.]|jgi:glycosyltransferase involved in cell wall biosynthesis|nr:glycosyltransferase [Prevotella sp.]